LQSLNQALQGTEQSTSRKDCFTFASNRRLIAQAAVYIIKYSNARCPHNEGT